LDLPAEYWKYQGSINQMELPNDDGPILCLFRIVLVIGLFTRLFDCDYDDEDDDDSKIPPSTELGALVALAKPSLMQPCGNIGRANVL
jgi:hypothetical protein